MAKKNTLLEDALKEAEIFRNMISENSTSNLIREELDNQTEEEDDDFDEEDVDSTLDNDSEGTLDNDTDFDAPEESLEGDTEEAEEGEDDIDFEDSEADEISMDADSEDILDDVDAGEEDVVLDMTDASDDEVIQVFKKMSNDDEIEIVDDTVKITDPESGNEYKVEMGENGLANDDVISDDEFSDEDLTSEEFDFGIEGLDLGLDSVQDNPYTRGSRKAKDQAMKDMNAEKRGDEFFDYVDDRDSLALNRDMGKKDELDLTDRHDDSHDMGKYKKETSFEDEPIYEEEEPLFEIELDEDEETIEEQIPVGLAQAKHKPAEPAIEAGIVGAGGAAALQEEIKQLKEQNAKLLAASKELVKENDMQRDALKVIKERIEETKVYTRNLSAISKLFLEHSTTKSEKQNIVDRFKTAKTINESQQIELSINGELTSRGTLSESVKNKINTQYSTSTSSKMINENKNVDPSIERMKRMM